jgi:hypothetical protein
MPGSKRRTGRKRSSSGSFEIERSGGEFQGRAQIPDLVDAQGRAILRPGRQGPRGFNREVARDPGDRPFRQVEPRRSTPAVPRSVG